MVMWQILWLSAVLLGMGIGFLADRNRASVGLGGFFGWFLGGIAIGVTLLFASCESGDLTTENKELGICTPQLTEERIASVERLTQTSASFVLGTGNISSRMYYYAYVERTDGWFLEQYRQPRTYIIEQSDEPKVVTTAWKCQQPFYSWLKGGTWSKTYKNQKHVIHVPENSIIREYHP